jgi:adenylate cyclase
VKNIAGPVRVYRVRAESPRPSPPPRAGEGSELGAWVGAAEQPVLPLRDKPSIAVLPFANMSGDPEHGYFADGMVEEIITALSRIRWLFVVARNSSFTYRGQTVDVKRVGGELGVHYVLEGSVREAGGRVRITAQLIDTLTGTHLWADRFNGTLPSLHSSRCRPRMPPGSTPCPRRCATAPPARRCKQSSISISTSWSASSRRAASGGIEHAPR